MNRENTIVNLSNNSPHNTISDLEINQSDPTQLNDNNQAIITIIPFQSLTTIQPVLKPNNQISAVSACIKHTFFSKIKIGYSVAVELYRAVSSSLLLLFIPQNQNMTVDWTDNSHFCNITLIINFITLFSFASLYSVELFREHRLNKYLTINAGPSNNTEISNTLAIMSVDKQRKILDVNKYYQCVGYLTMAIFAINTILSGLVINQTPYYYNGQTETTFIVYVLFMLAKLTNVYMIISANKYTFYSAHLKSNAHFDDINPSVRLRIEGENTFYSDYIKSKVHFNDLDKSIRDKIKEELGLPV